MLDGPETYRATGPAAVRPDDDRFVGLAAELGAQFAARATEHDRDNTFVEDNFRALRDSRYTALAVPTELGGLGATLRQVCYAQATLARGCASTALAINMHVFLTLANTYRWINGAAAAEGLLRRVATDGLLLMSSGAADGLWPTTTATREDGGYRVVGRKPFCSEAPIADVLALSPPSMTPRRGASFWGSASSAPAPDFGWLRRGTRLACAAQPAMTCSLTACSSPMPRSPADGHGVISIPSCGAH